MKINRYGLVTIAVLLIATGASLTHIEASAAGDQRNFVVHLSGHGGVPIITTLAQGEAFFQLSADGNSLQYTLIVANIQNVFMAHIHKGLATQIGPIIVWLFPSTTAGVTKLVTGRLDGVAVKGTITASDLGGSIAGQPLSALVSLIESGQAYVNVHTMQNPGGEIRGQIGVAESSESTEI